MAVGLERLVELPRPEALLRASHYHAPGRRPRFGSSAAIFVRMSGTRRMRAGVLRLVHRLPRQSGAPMTDDPYGLHRFVSAQADAYPRALRELEEGRKRSHWMWFIFPQIAGLGMSETARFYAIGSEAEAKAYLGHPILGARIVECAGAALQHSDRSAVEIFGRPDDLKLRSSATLFASISPADSVFQRVLDHFFEGEPDGRTLALLGALPDNAK
jgi:uncharacterized protein (DUF1810 family)